MFPDVLHVDAFSQESPDEQEVSDAESDASAKYVPRVRQLSRKPRASNLTTKQRYPVVVGGDGEYVAETRNNNDDDYRQNGARSYQEMRNLVLELEELERLKRAEVATISNDKQRIERRGLDARINRQKNSGDAASYFVTSKPSYSLIKESIDKNAKDLALNGSAHFTKLDKAAKNRVLESIDRMVGIMDDAKVMQLIVHVIDFN